MEYLIYLAIMAVSTYLIRVIPFVLVKKRIENKFLRSFLHYIPYAVLTAMTFPAVLYATGNMVAAAAGLVVAILLDSGSGSCLLRRVPYGLDRVPSLEVLSRISICFSLLFPAYHDTMSKNDT